MAQRRGHYSAVSTVSAQIRRQRYTSPALVEEIERLATVDRFGPKDIERKLKADARFAVVSLPSLRTIQDVVKDAQARDASAPWSIAADDLLPTVDPAIVLPVVAWLAEETEGRRPFVTREEAHWIARIGRAVPGLKARWVWELAWKYAQRRQQEQELASLDELLAFATWANEQAFARYVHFVVRRQPARAPAEGKPSFDGGIATALRMEADRRNHSETDLLTMWNLYAVPLLGESHQ